VQYFLSSDPVPNTIEVMLFYDLKLVWNEIKLAASVAIGTNNIITSEIAKNN
jgi:hypothetical protein